MVVNHGSLRKKVVCFNNIVSFGLTTNRPKEPRGMACDDIFATDYHGLSRYVRAVPCHSVPLRCYHNFVGCFLHRSFTDINGCFPCQSVAGTIAFDVGHNEIYTEHPCASV